MTFPHCFLLWACTSRDTGGQADDVTGDGGASDDTGLPDDSAPPDDTAEPPVDADKDGFPVGEDCDDGNAAVNPGAAEVCNGFDDDCDEGADDADPQGAQDAADWYRDADGDGYGESSETQTACVAPKGYIATAGDCNDASELVAPGLVEVCGDGLDNDCDGTASGCRLDGEWDLETVRSRWWQLDRFEDYSVVLTSLALGSDVDADGRPEVVAGSPTSSCQGAAFVLPIDAASGSLNAAASARLTIEDAVPEGGYCAGELGSAIAAADIDMDGTEDLVLGAEGLYLPVEGGLNTNLGAVFVGFGPVVGEVNLWEEGLHLRGAQSSDQFGHAVLVVPDLSDDGLPELLVGANRAPGTEGTGGSAYLFRSPLSAHATRADADMWWASVDIQSSAGSRTELAGDVDGDGVPEGLVADPDYEVSSSVRWSSVFLVDLEQTGFLALPDAPAVFRARRGADAQLGTDLQGAFDHNGDGYDDVALGAPGDGIEDWEGQVAILHGPFEGDVMTADAPVLVQGTVELGELGTSLVVRDLDGDEVLDLAVRLHCGDRCGKEYPETLLFYAIAEGHILQTEADAHIQDQETSSGNTQHTIDSLQVTSVDGLTTLALGEHFVHFDGIAYPGAISLVPLPGW